MPTILTKKKDTAGAPAPGDLTNSAGGAELAVNTFDKRLYTKNAGGSVVEIGTNPSTIDTTTVDTTNLEVTNIKAKDGTASATIADSTGIFTHSTATVFPAGTVSAPSITTAGDTNTGIYFPAADTIAFTEGGVEGMRLNSAGNVGIGTATLAARLTINGGAGTAQTRFEVNTTEVQEVATNAAQNAYANRLADAAQHVWKLSSVEAMRLNASGNFGIGTVSPRAPLAFAATTSTAGVPNKIRLFDDGASNLYGFNVSSGLLDIISGTAGGIAFYTNGANERMRIDSAGNVGIGTASPAAKLDVVGAGGGGTQMVVSDGANQGRLQLSKSAAFYGFNAGADYGGIQFFSNGTEHMRIGTTSRVSIGTTVQVARLTVQNMSTTDSATIDLRGNRNFVAETFGATSIIAFSDGTRNSHDFGAIRFEQNPATSDGGGALVRLFAGGASSSFAANSEFLRGDARGNTNGVDNIQFRTAGTERMRIDLNGNVGIGTSSFTQALSIARGAGVGAGIEMAGNGATLGTNSVFVGQGNEGTCFVYQRAAGNIAFGTSNTERMRITATGALCLNTSSTLGAKFVLHGASGGTDSYIQITNPGYGTGTLGVLGTSSNFKIYNSYSAGTLGTGAGIDITVAGEVCIGTTTPNAGALITGNVTTAKNIYEAVSNSSGMTHYLVNTSLSTAGGSDALGVYDAGGISARITTNGFFQSRPNSYGGTSDIKLKENVVDATPKLEDLMAVRVRNFNFKDEPNVKQIGVVAQELESVFPSLVYETPDRDSKGKDVGTTTKSVKYSVFVPMLIKAMQEQQALIEQLTTRLNALEGK